MPEKSETTSKSKLVQMLSPGSDLRRQRYKNTLLPSIAQQQLYMNVLTFSFYVNTKNWSNLWYWLQFSTRNKAPFQAALKLPHWSSQVDVTTAVCFQERLLAALPPLPNATGPGWFLVIEVPSLVWVSESKWAQSLHSGEVDSNSQPSRRWPQHKLRCSPVLLWWSFNVAIYVQCSVIFYRPVHIMALAHSKLVQNSGNKLCWREPELLEWTISCPFQPQI